MEFGVLNFQTYPFERKVTHVVSSQGCQSLTHTQSVSSDLRFWTFKYAVPAVTMQFVPSNGGWPNADWLVQPLLTYLFGVETITDGVIHLTGAYRGEFSRSMWTCSIVRSA